MDDMKKHFKKAIGDSQYGVDGLLACLFVAVVMIIPVAFCILSDKKAWADFFTFKNSDEARSLFWFFLTLIPVATIVIVLVS